MSADEEARLLQALPVDLRAVLLVGLDTLTRLSNILELRRSDDHGTHLDILDTKNGLSHIWLGPNAVRGVRRRNRSNA